MKIHTDLGLIIPELDNFGQGCGRTLRCPKSDFGAKNGHFWQSADSPQHIYQVRWMKIHTDLGLIIPELDNFGQRCGIPLRCPKSGFGAKNGHFWQSADSPQHIYQVRWMKIHIDLGLIIPELDNFGQGRPKSDF